MLRGEGKDARWGAVAINMACSSAVEVPLCRAMDGGVGVLRC